VWVVDESAAATAMQIAQDLPRYNVKINVKTAFQLNSPEFATIEENRMQIDVF
jgi:hypothetical protein